MIATLADFIIVVLDDAGMFTTSVSSRQTIWRDDNCTRAAAASSSRARRMIPKERAAH